MSDYEHSEDEELQEEVSKSFIADGNEVGETLVKYGANEMHFKCTVRKKAWRPGSTVPITVSIKNETKKEVKSIRLALFNTVLLKRTSKKGKLKEKWGKPELTPDSEQEYFEGARFPLPPSTDFHGEIKFPLPERLADSGDKLTYELVFEFPTSGFLTDHHTKVRIPIQIDNCA